MRLRASLIRLCGSFAAAIVIAGTAIAQVCPSEGKQYLHDLTTDLGTYAVYVFRGRSAPQGGLCVQTAKFLPHGSGSVAFDRNNDHFITGEFAAGVVKVPASSYTCEPPACPPTIAGLSQFISFPFNATHKPFLNEFPNERGDLVTFQTGSSVWAVGAGASPGAVSGHDRIWVPQAGSFWIFPIATVRVGTNIIPVKAWENHGRLAAYDNGTGVTKIYNLPGDWNHPHSPLWDPERNRLWFVESGVDFNRPRIGSFDPDRLNPVAISDTEDFQDPAKLDAVICRPGQDEATCIKYFDLPPVHPPFPGMSLLGVNMPVFIVKTQDGRIWTTAHLSGNLLSLDPATGQIDLYPLALDPTGVEVFGRAPFQMSLGPDGVLYFTGFHRVSAIDTRTAPTTPACKALNAAGQNPCVQEFHIKQAYDAQYGLTYGVVGFAMSTVYVDSANDVVWFGGGVSKEGPLPGVGAAPLVGYIDRATSQVRFLPPIQDLVYRRLPNTPDIFGERELSLHLAANGTDLWGTDYFGGRLYLLKKRPG